MPDKREYRLKINAYDRETMPMRALVEYLSDLALLFGQESGVHLIAIESSSTTPVILVDWEVEPRVADRITKARDGQGSEDAIRAIRNIDERLAKQNTSADLLGPRENKLIIFPGIKKEKQLEWPSINQAADFYGVPLAVGGKNDPVPVHLIDGAAEHFLLAERAKAKQIASYLFTEVLHVWGRGRWRKAPGGPWALERFVIEEFEPVKTTTFADAINELRNIDAAWKRLDDPLYVLKNIRDGEP